MIWGNLRRYAGLTISIRKFEAMESARTIAHVRFDRAIHAEPDSSSATLNSGAKALISGFVDCCNQYPKL